MVESTPRRKRNSIPSPMHRAMCVAKEDVANTVVSPNHVRKFAVLEKSNRIQSRQLQGERGMVHGEENGPAAELGKSAVKPGEATLAKPPTMRARFVCIEEHEGACRCFEDRLNETVLVDLRLKENPFERFAIVVVAHQ